METRICKVCGSVLPLSKEYFKPSNRAGTTFRHVCRSCYSREEKTFRETRRAEGGERMERVRQSQRKWKESNPEKHIAQIVRRTRERQREDPVYKWTIEARRGVRSAVNAQKSAHFSDARVKEITGLDKTALREHLLKTYKEIYGEDCDFIEPTHVDHIIPLCTEDTIEGRKLLFYYTNLRLVKEKDNRAKGTSLDYEITA